MKASNAHDYAKELILLGVMLAQDGDGARARSAVKHTLFTGGATKHLAAAIQEGNAQQVWELLAPWGIQQLNQERVVDSLLRIYLQDRKQQIEDLLKQASDGLESEINRPANKE